MHIIGKFFKALFISLIGAIFSSIILIGFNFSSTPLEAFLQVFWPTTLFCTLLCFTGSYTYFAINSDKIKQKKQMGFMKALWIALSIILFAMTAKGYYEYATSPLRLNAEIHGIKRGSVKQLSVCKGNNCGVRYDGQVPRGNKYY